MYKNPLNNGKLSDNNSLKKQRDYGSIIKKYENKKLETKPTELQKYYQYLTYQQPILDELNYVAERMRTEDIKTKNDDYNFIEDLKIKREKQMAEDAKQEEGIRENRVSLFDYSSTIKQDDMTPIINTDVEMETPLIIEEQQAKVELFGGGDNDELFSIADTIPIKEEKFELSREEEKPKKEKPKKERKKKAIKEEKFELSLEEEKPKKEKPKKERKKKAIKEEAIDVDKNILPDLKEKPKKSRGKRGKMGSKK
jgi:hypothetical protein